MNTERIERIKLAWAILWASDTELVRHVRSEVGRIDRDVALNCTNIARVFSLEGHSGCSASIVIPWIEKALLWEPIAPLTGDSDEWVEVYQDTATGYPLWQNKRCSRVFKEADGKSYDVSGIVFRDPDGACYTNVKSRTEVVFPYLPSTTYVDCSG